MCHLKLSICYNKVRTSLGNVPLFWVCNQLKISFAFSEEPTEKQNDTALVEVEAFKTPPIESSCETSSLENQESHEDVKIESFKDDSPFSPPAPPGEVLSCAYTKLKLGIQLLDN